MNDQLHQRPQEPINSSEQHPRVNELASRWARFAAAIIDAVILSIVIIPLSYYFGVFDGLQETPPKEPSLLYAIPMVAANIMLYAVVNWSLLKQRGQTVGKSILGIKIVNMNGEILRPDRVILNRYTPYALIPLVPFIGTLASVIGLLLIFGKERRCLHDHIASTRVVNAGQSA